MNVALNSVGKLNKFFPRVAVTPLIVTERGVKRHTSKLLRTLKSRSRQYREKYADQLVEATRRSNFSDWNLNAEVYAFGKRLNEDFRIELLLQAFVHRSYIDAEEAKQRDVGIDQPIMGLQDNELLAREGEKIISEYVSVYLAYFLPRFPLEGITSLQNYLTSEETLAYVSKNLGTTYIILSAVYPVDNPTYAKTIKAIVGALAESQGIERARIFVRDFIITLLFDKDVNSFLEIKNPLKVLTDILKRDGRGTPEPRIISQSSMKSIYANYHIGIYSDQQLIGHCAGETIDTAIEMAARESLKRLFRTTDSDNPIRYDVTEVGTQVTNVRLDEWSSEKAESSALLRDPK